MSKNKKIGLSLAIGGTIAFIFLQGLLIWDCQKTEERLAEIEQLFSHPDSTRFSANNDTLFFFSGAKIFAVPLPEN